MLIVAYVLSGILARQLAAIRILEKLAGPPEPATGIYRIARLPLAEYEEENHVTKNRPRALCTMA
jgi:hypothetical protein